MQDVDWDRALWTLIIALDSQGKRRGGVKRKTRSGGDKREGGEERFLPEDRKSTRTRGRQLLTRIISRATDIEDFDAR